MSGMDPRGLRKVSSHFTITLAPDRTQSAEVVRNVVQCLVSGTRSFPVVAEIDAGSDQEVTGLSNCSVGQVWRLPETNLVVTEMVRDTVSASSRAASKGLAGSPRASATSFT